MNEEKSKMLRRSFKTFKENQSFKRKNDRCRLNRCQAGGGKEEFKAGNRRMPQDIGRRNKNILLFKEEESRLQVRGAKLESDMDALKSRMFDEYEITYAEAVNRRNTAIEEEISPREISELKNQINALGSVDVTSISEYAETKARYDFNQAAAGNGRSERKIKTGGLRNELRYESEVFGKTKRN